MLRMLTLIFIIGLAGLACAFDTGNQFNDPKVPLPYDPNQGDGREGGETIATAFPIPALPYSDTGNTCDNIDDYDEACPFLGSTAPDVVYSFAPTADVFVTVDLCYSSYDTKVFVYANMATPGNPVACNDDFYFDAPCYHYSSKVRFVATVGNTYYIVIDGYFGACGTYDMEVTGEPPPPPITCPYWGWPEFEPPLVDYYVDNWNGGCNSTPPVFQEIRIDLYHYPCGTLCGVSGWYHSLNDTRDTDWFAVTAYWPEMSFEVCAEFACNMYVLNTDCSNIIVLYQANTGGIDQCATIEWPTSVGDQFWLWVGPDTFSGPVNEFDYVMTVCGYYVISAEAATWGSVKAMYRDATR